MSGRTPDGKPTAWSKQIDQRWKRNRCAVSFTPSQEVQRSSKRTLRRELSAYVGRPVSGRQWKRWAKAQRREEAAMQRGDQA